MSVTTSLIMSATVGLCTGHLVTLSILSSFVSRRHRLHQFRQFYVVRLADREQSPKRRIVYAADPFAHGAGVHAYLVREVLLAHLVPLLNASDPLADVRYVVSHLSSPLISAPHSPQKFVQYSDSVPHWSQITPKLCPIVAGLPSE